MALLSISVIHVMGVSLLCTCWQEAVTAARPATRKTESIYSINARLKEADYFNSPSQRNYEPRSSRDSTGSRPGTPTTTNSCSRVRRVPKRLRSARVMKPNGLSNFYQKYTEAYGIPVVASRKVSNEAMRRACYVLRFLFAGNSKVRNSFYKMAGRVGIIGIKEETTDIPEHSYLADWWNDRARGLGATEGHPICTAGEENILCRKPDRYPSQDIFLHETAHGVHILGAKYGIPRWDRRLGDAYKSAKRRGLWRNTYAMTDYREYFAEGTQSYFNVNAYANPPNGINNDINTRRKLRKYDPTLYKLIKEVFPCDNSYIKRCEKDRGKELAQSLKMDCDINGAGGASGNGGGTGGGENKITSTACTDQGKHCQYWKKTYGCEGEYGSYMSESCKKSCNLCKISVTAPSNCIDKHKDCAYWERTGECEKTVQYMLNNCQKSCGVCDKST